MAVPKSRSSKRRQGNRESCKRLVRLKNANNLKSIVSIVKNDELSFSKQFSFENNHQINSEGIYNGKKYRERKIKKEAQ